jgi:hypothetical protein
VIQNTKDKTTKESEKWKSKLGRGRKGIPFMVFARENAVAL